MENHLQAMQNEVEAMEKMISNPAEGESVSTDEAHIDPAETLDSMIENVDVIEEVPVEEPKKRKRTNWKSRYSKYKTTTDATIYELRKENATYISQIQLLGRQLDDVSKSAVDSDTTTFSDRFTDVDKEIFGEDALSSLEAATDAAVAPLKEQLAQEKMWREQQLELQRTKNKQSANTYFLNALADEVPEYAEIDTDPAFEQWMNQPDAASGIKRVQLFKQAEQNGDVSRVANFMKDFKQATEPVDHLKDKVSPVSTSATSPVNTQGEKISMVDVNKFYDDVMKGRYRGNDKVRLEMETKINTALGNGDVY